MKNSWRIKKTLMECRNHKIQAKKFFPLLKTYKIRNRMTIKILDLLWFIILSWLHLWRRWDSDRNFLNFSINAFTFYAHTRSNKDCTFFSVSVKYQSLLTWRAERIVNLFRNLDFFILLWKIRTCDDNQCDKNLEWMKRMYILM